MAQVPGEVDNMEGLPASNNNNPAARWESPDRGWEREQPTAPSLFECSRIKALAGTWKRTGWGKRGRGLLGCCLYASMSAPRWPGRWEDSYRHLDLESLDQHCPVKLPVMMGKCSLSGVSNILSTSTCSYEHLKCGQCLLMNWICNFI